MRGKFVVLHFWSISCQECLEEILRLELMREMFADDWVILLVNKSDNPKKVGQFLEEHSITKNSSNVNVICNFKLKERFI